MDIGPDLETGDQHHHHHHHTGRPWVDMVIAVSAIVISLISLIVAIENGNTMQQLSAENAEAMKKLVVANSWPAVRVGATNVEDDGTPRLDLVIINNGVGPATIQSVEVLYDNRSIRTADALMRAVLGSTYDVSKMPYGSSQMIGKVLASKEKVDFLDFSAKHGKHVSPQVLADIAKLSQASNRIGLRACYCSVFDECWRVGSGLGRTPKPVKVCPEVKTPYPS